VDDCRRAELMKCSSCFVHWSDRDRPTFRWQRATPIIVDWFASNMWKNKNNSFT